MDGALQARYGDFFVLDTDDLIIDSLLHYSEWAQEELDVLTKFIGSGDVVIDAGAFIGTHARAFSEMVGENGVVHAFEPNPAIHPVLVKNAELAAVQNIRPYPYALGAVRLSVVVEKDHKGNIGASAVKQAPADDNTGLVPLLPLDDLDIDGVDFIKVDVEGMEAEVLNGGKRLIEKCHPVIFLELNDLQHGSQCLAFAKAQGYKVFGVLSSAFNKNNFNSNPSNIFGEAKECGLLLIHQKKLIKWDETIVSLNLRVISTLDDLAVLLLQKPQYVAERRIQNFQHNFPLESSVQLFFVETTSESSSDGPIYRESRSVGAAYRVDGTQQAIVLTLPADLTQLAGIRLDMSNSPVALLLYDLVLENSDGNRLWQWHRAKGSFKSIVDTLCATNENGMWMLCLSDDPQLELNIPEEILAQLDPGSRLLVGMSPYPLLEALPDVLAQVQVEAHVSSEEHTYLPASPNLTREFVAAAQLMKSVIERRNSTIEDQRAEIAALKKHQQDLEVHVHRAESQLEVIKEFVQAAFGQANDRI